MDHHHHIHKLYCQVYVRHMQPDDRFYKGRRLHNYLQKSPMLLTRIKFVYGKVGALNLQDLKMVDQKTNTAKSRTGK